MGYQSQSGEDKWIAENLNLPAQGFYVDIGAAWPDLISNTAFLRERGWKGLQIDANPMYSMGWSAKGLELIVAVIWTEETAHFKFCPENSGLSKVDPTGDVLPARKLNDILTERGVAKIDLLTIDVEGAEYPIMTTLDWDRFAPTVIIWEYNTLGVEDHRLKEFLEANGYRCAHKTVHNYIHVKD